MKILLDSDPIPEDPSVRFKHYFRVHCPACKKTHPVRLAHDSSGYERYRCVLKTATNSWALSPEPVRESVVLHCPCGVSTELVVKQEGTLLCLEMEVLPSDVS